MALPETLAAITKLNHQRIDGLFLPTVPFLELCECFATVVGRLGNGMAIIRQDIRGNISKIKKSKDIVHPSVYANIYSLVQTCQSAPSSDPEEGSKVSDAAVGLLWLYRTMLFIVNLTSLLIEDGPPEKNDSLHMIARKAYLSSIEPYHGWFLHQLTDFVMRFVPTRKHFLAALEKDCSALDDGSFFVEEPEEPPEKVLPTTTRTNYEDKTKPWEVEIEEELCSTRANHKDKVEQRELDTKEVLISTRAKRGGETPPKKGKRPDLSVFLAKLFCSCRSEGDGADPPVQRTEPAGARPPAAPAPPAKAPPTGGGAAAAAAAAKAPPTGGGGAAAAGAGGGGEERAGPAARLGQFVAGMRPLLADLCAFLRSRGLDDPARV